MEVLLVDQNPAVLEQVEATLRGDSSRSPFTVMPAREGLSGLDIAFKKKPGLILVDSHLEGIALLDFLKKIRKRADLAKTPIILLTDPDNLPPTELQSAGFQAMLAKPIDPVALSEEVRKRYPVEEAPSSAMATVLPDRAVEETAVRLSSRMDDRAEAIQSAIVIDPENVEEEIRKTVLEVVERVAWEVVPAMVETTLSKEILKPIVEEVVWQTVPPLAEIEIKKEIKRLQPDEEIS